MGQYVNWFPVCCTGSLDNVLVEYTCNVKLNVKYPSYSQVYFDVNIIVYCYCLSCNNHCILFLDKVLA